MASLTITVRLMSGEQLCSIEAEPDWTFANLESKILPSLPAGRFLKRLLLGSQELDGSSQMLSELGFTTEGENILTASLQQGVPPGTYEGEGHGFGWTFVVSAASKFSFQKREGSLAGEKVQGRIDGDLLFESCEIQDAVGVKIRVSKWARKVFSPSPYFYCVASFPEDGKMILKTQYASAVLAGVIPPTMPTNMEEEQDFEVISYSRVEIECRAEEEEEEEAEQRDCPTAEQLASVQVSWSEIGG